MDFIKIWKEVFYLMTHSKHFIYGYMASDIWYRTTQIAREETRCCHMGYSFQLAAMVLLYASSHRQDNTYHVLCYTSRGALAGKKIAQWVHSMKDRSDDSSHHEQTVLPQSYISLRYKNIVCVCVYIHTYTLSSPFLTHTHTHTHKDVIIKQLAYKNKI